MMKILCILILICSVLTGCVVSLDANLVTDSDSPENMLWKGINSGNYELVKEAVNKSADINRFSNKKFYERNEHNKKVSSPLFVAIVLGKYKIAEYLIECGADVNCVDSSGVSLLQYCSEFAPSLVELLLLHNADITYEDKKGNTALEYSVNYQVNNTNKFSFDILLEYGGVPTSKTVEALMLNLNDDKYGMLKTMLELIENPPVDKFVKNAFLGSSEVVVDEENKDIILGGIAAFGNWDVLKQYLEHEDISYLSRLFKLAVMYNNKAVVNSMLNRYENLKNVGKWDYLYYAAANGDVELVDSVYKSLGGNAPLAMAGAILKLNNDVVEYLVLSGIDLNSRVYEGTLLSACCMYNNYDAARMLLENGAIADDDALTKACKDGKVDFIKLYLENGADANCKNVYQDGSGGYSALLQAIDCGQLEATKILIEHGADIYYEYFDENAIERAQKAGAEEIYNYMIRVSQNGVTPNRPRVQKKNIQ